MRDVLGRGRVPAHVRDALALHGHERVLASAVSGDADHLVATDQALHLPATDGYERIGWERVEQAEWSESELHLRVLGERRARTYPVDHPGSLPELVQERVTASIVVNEYVRLDGQRGVRILARRRADMRELSWSMVFDHSLDPDDPKVRRVAEEALATIRDQTGV